MSELSQKSTYKKEIINPLKEIVEIYTRIVVDYLNFMKKSNKIKKKQCFKFILYKGLETMTHAFNYILFCTKDLSVAKYYAEKSMFYYLEFVSQIHKDQHIFLQFTSRDAVIYVYKKTIYEVRQSFVAEPTKETLDICDNINLYTQMVKNIASSCDDLLSDNIIESFEKMYSNIHKCNDCLKLVDESFPLS